MDEYTGFRLLIRPSHKYTQTEWDELVFSHNLHLVEIESIQALANGEAIIFFTGCEMGIISEGLQELEESMRYDLPGNEYWLLAGWQGKKGEI